MRVLIQRVYEYCPEKNPEIAKAVEVFRANGFDVFESGRPEQKPEPEPSVDEHASRRAVITQAVAGMMSRGGLSSAAACRLFAIDQTRLAKWMRGFGRVDDKTLARVKAVEERLAGKSAGEIVTVVEAVSAQQGIRGRRQKLTETERAEVAQLLRDGVPPREIAATYRMSLGSVDNYRRRDVGNATTTEV